MGGHVLIVDDHPINIKLLRFVLEARKIQVMTAGSAEDARRSIEADLPGVILMDIQLPGTDGLTLTRELRADNRLQNVAIVAVTAYAMASDESSAREAGCDGFVAKPIDTRAMGELVQRLLKEGRACDRGSW